MTTQSHARKPTPPLGISTIAGIALFSSGAPQTSEIRYAEFRTEVEVPAGVAPDRVEANYSGSFLEVLLLKLRSRVTVFAG